MKTEPWIDSTGAPVDEIVLVIQMCPSGALSYTKDGVKHESQDRSSSINLSKDGPYRVVGGIELDDYNGSTPHLKEHYTLCQCGGSKNKPFCDGTHWYIKFEHDESTVPLEEEKN